MAKAKKYQVAIGPYKSKKEAVKEFIVAHKVIRDIAITIKEQEFIIDCGTYDKKENAETIKNILKGVKAKIIIK